MNNPSFAHISITCDDPLNVERFYSKYFGFRRERVVQLGEDNIIFTRAGNLVFEIFKATEERPIPKSLNDGPPYSEWRHIAFEVENVDAFITSLGDDAKVTLGPMEFNDFIPGWKSAWISDPEGNIIEISQGYKEQEPRPDAIDF